MDGPVVQFAYGRTVPRCKIPVSPTEPRLLGGIRGGVLPLLEWRARVARSESGGRPRGGPRLTCSALGEAAKGHSIGSAGAKPAHFAED